MFGDLTRAGPRLVQSRDRDEGSRVCVGRSNKGMTWTASVQPVTYGLSSVSLEIEKGEDTP